MSEPIARGNFIAPCLTCGATVHTVDGKAQPHPCEPAENARSAIARAYWSGFDEGYATCEAVR